MNSYQNSFVWILWTHKCRWDCPLLSGKNIHLMSPSRLWEQPDWSSERVFQQRPFALVVTKAQGGTNNLQRKHYSQSAFLDLNSNEFKSILQKINSNSLQWYLEILLFSCCENVCSASSSLFDLTAVWSTACKIKHVPFPQAEEGKLKIQGAAEHQWLAVQENFFILQLSQDL